MIYYSFLIAPYLFRHADGSVKFWDASAGTLQILYKLKCSKGKSLLLS